jgi:thioredoxin reductase
MAANDGTVPVRTLAYAARLLRGTAQLGRYGIGIGAARLDYGQLLRRAREVTDDVREHAAFRGEIDRLGVTVHERAGLARFADPHTIETESGLRLHADRIILCAGGVSRRLTVPGAEWTATHSDAWSLTEAPRSMIVVGAGMTGVQVASIFQTFGSQVSLWQKGPRILPAEDAEVSAAVAAGFRASGMVVREAFGAIESFEKSPGGIRMTVSKDGVREVVEASLCVTAIGWIADADRLNLDAADVERDARGYVSVDTYLRTSAPHVFAAGDITGRWMLVPQAAHDGWVAATNAVRGPTRPLDEGRVPNWRFLRARVREGRRDGSRSAFDARRGRGHRAFSRDDTNDHRRTHGRVLQVTRRPCEPPDPRMPRRRRARCRNRAGHRDRHVGRHARRGTGPASVVVSDVHRDTRPGGVPNQRATRAGVGRLEPTRRRLAPAPFRGLRAVPVVGQAACRPRSTCRCC